VTNCLRFLTNAYEAGRKDVVVITSKIIAICQGRVVKNDGKISKHYLMIKEADYYLPEEYVNYGIT